MEKIPALVIGAGVVGCAVAYELSRKGFAPWIIEQGPRIAEGVTSRNSGVIHAGLYYPPGSLKAETCIEGQALLYEWCAKNGVPHRQTGKWIVAQAGEESALETILENALKSGAKGLDRVSGAQLSELAPGVRGKEALWCSMTGIIDPYSLARSFLDRALEKGAELATCSRVIGVERTVGGYLVETDRGKILSERVVNCAGLEADRIAALLGAKKYTLYPWRGDYYSIQRKLNVNSLVYPVKRRDDPGLGIHLTIDLDGGLRLGPDVYLAASREDFSDPNSDLQKRNDFYKAASRYLVDLRFEDLAYSTCGIRPKLRAPGDKVEHDFVLREDLPGWVNLIGIESPGLTASPSLARRVGRLFST